MSGFRDARENEAETIPWLGSFAAALEAAYGRGQDVDLETLKLGMYLRWANTCPDDALDRVGVRFKLPRLGPDETNDSYRARLIAVWETWIFAGTTKAIVDSIRAWGIPDVEVYRDYEGHFASGEWYSRFWVVLGPNYGTKAFQPLTMPFVQPVTMGSTATIAQVNELKRQLLQWKAPHGYPVKVILRFGDVSLQKINTTMPFVQSGETSIQWRIGKLQNDTIKTFPFVQGGYFE